MNDDELNERIAQMIAARMMVQNNRLAEQATRIFHLETQIEALMKTPAESGIFPPLHEIQRMQVQVFHTSDLTPKQRMGGRTEWSLKVEYWHRGSKQPPINIGLVTHDKLLAKLIERKAPAAIIEAVEVMPTDAIGGIIRRRLATGGREYDLSQVAMMMCHEDGHNGVRVGLQIGDDAAVISQFGPAKGSKTNSAVYFGKWSAKSAKHHDDGDEFDL